LKRFSNCRPKLVNLFLLTETIETRPISRAQTKRIGSIVCQTWRNSSQIVKLCQMNAKRCLDGSAWSLYVSRASCVFRSCILVQRGGLPVSCATARLNGIEKQLKCCTHDGSLAEFSLCRLEVGWTILRGTNKTCFTSEFRLFKSECNQLKARAQDTDVALTITSC
jgi:hypothetical protein